MQLVPQFFDSSERPSPSDEKVSDLGEGKRTPPSAHLPPRSHGVLDAQSMYPQRRGITHLQPMSDDTARPRLARRPVCGDVHLARRARGSRRTDQPKSRTVREKLVIGHPCSERPAAVEKRVIARFLGTLPDDAPKRVFHGGRSETAAADAIRDSVVKRQRVGELNDGRTTARHPPPCRADSRQDLAEPRPAPHNAPLGRCGGSNRSSMSPLFTSNGSLR